MANISLNCSRNLQIRRKASKMNRFFFQMLNALSLDSALVAILWQLLLAKAWGTPCSLLYSFLLGAAVWLGFTADRLFDGFIISDKFRSFRHGFAFKHRKKVLLAWILVAAFSIFLGVENLSVDDFRSGIILACLCALNAILTFTDRKVIVPIPKEVRNALLFSSGVFFFVFIHLDGLTIIHWTVFVQLTILWFLNCCLISYWEKDLDLVQGQSSLVLRKSFLSSPFLRNAITLSSSTALALSLHPALVNSRDALLSCAMALILLQAVGFLGIENESKRIIADCCLWIPCLLFLPIAG